MSRKEITTKTVVGLLENADIAYWMKQLGQQAQLSRSALGSYEADDCKDISGYAIYQAGEVLRRD